VEQETEDDKQQEIQLAHLQLCLRTAIVQISAEAVVTLLGEIHHHTCQVSQFWQ